MQYLMPMELLQNGFRLYWARTKNLWRSRHRLLSHAYKEAKAKYEELELEYRNYSAAQAIPSGYQTGYEEGQVRAAYLRREGLPLETMSNNRYSGENFLGLFGYLDAMKESHAMD